ncbi:efflux RND transporter periplasmic adaptor subunit [Methylocapsa acidiphila]|uniref:efflux RND transporter periplasmic adaptor subunit n=1 Tax=Methylocapsa acidiphila TaxID=133552 RepID=UPI001FD8CA49|nr:efflux RND transporter periplasmic adaptor subunit [Methylocapsa acidiphila]
MDTGSAPRARRKNRSPSARAYHAARQIGRRVMMASAFGFVALIGGGADESQAASWWEKLFESSPPAKSQQTPSPQPSPNPQSSPVIPVVLPKLQAVTDYVEVTGNAASVNTVKLIARVEGYLEKLHFADGAVAKKDDLLFTVQQDQYKAQLQQAQAQLFVQQAALAYAKTEVARYGALVKKDAATQIELDHWHFEQAKAEGDLRSAQAQVVIAQLNMSYTEVRAPFDGLMGKHLIDPGNVIGGVGQQAAVAEILQLDPIYVVANLSEQEALQIRANLDQRRLSLAELTKIPVDVGLENGNGFPYRGTIEYVAPGIDPSTGTLLVRGILRNPNRTLLPGMFVRIRLPRRLKAQQALLVPNRALGEDQGGRYLLIVNKDDIVEQRYVQLGELYGTLRVVTAGIEPDDRIVVGELWRAAPGTKVTPKPNDADSSSSAPDDADRNARP